MKSAASHTEFLRVFAASILVFSSLFSVAFSHGGEDHGEQSSVATAATTSGPIASAKAERNIDTDSGKFLLRIERYPADPRTGELVQLALKVFEKVEGGFGANEPIVIEDAAVAFTVTTVRDRPLRKSAATFENGFYRADYEFGGTGISRSLRTSRLKTAGCLRRIFRSVSQQRR